MAIYTVQRELKVWETQKIEADSFEDAKEKADEELHAYQLIDKTYETTGDYWIRNEETEEDRTDF